MPTSMKGLDLQTIVVTIHWLGITDWVHRNRSKGTILLLEYDIFHPLFVNSPGILNLLDGLFCDCSASLPE